MIFATFCCAKAKEVVGIMRKIMGKKIARIWIFAKSTCK
jgi:hypothetical protein